MMIMLNKLIWIKLLNLIDI